MIRAVRAFAGTVLYLYDAFDFRGRRAEEARIRDLFNDRIWTDGT